MPWSSCMGGMWYIYIYIIYGENKNNPIFGIQTQNPRIWKYLPKFGPLQTCVFCWLKAPGCIWYATRVGKYVLSLFWLNHPTIFGGYSTYPKKIQVWLLDVRGWWVAINIYIYVYSSIVVLLKMHCRMSRFFHSAHTSVR